MNAKHTPTPWKVGPHTVILSNEGGYPTAIADIAIPIRGKGADYAEQQANAAFIVRAVNAHEELLALLKEVHEYGAHGAKDLEAPIIASCKYCRAIAKAEDL